MMTSLKVSQIKSKLLSMFEPHLDLSDIGAKDTEREQKILSRCLSALAIYIQTGCTEKDAAEAVWDGADDNGIDAAYFDPSDQRVILTQGKWINKGAGEPEAKEIGTFAAGVKDVIEQDNSMFRAALHTKFSDIAARLSNPGTSIHLVVVTTGSSQIAKHAKAHLDKLISALNGAEPDPIATYELMGLTEVYSHLAKDPTQGNVSVDAQILDWSYVPAPYGAYFGIIDGLTLKTWWKTYGKRLLAANIRHALGSTEVNNEIKQSASTKPQQFWYFNNGITLVAGEATKAPIAAASRSAGNFTFKGASIVNGAQTVSTLAKVDDASLGQVRVPIRVMLLNSAPAGFGDEVTRTNNLQNRVEPRDFAAQDLEQRRIRQEMLIEGIDYQFLRSEEVSPTPTSCDLMEVTAALVCAAGDAALAVQLKTGIGRFFVDITKAPYRSVFNPTVSGAKAFNAVLVNRIIEAWIDTKKGSVAKKSGTQWGTLIHGNRILAAAVFSKYGPANLSKPIQSFRATLNPAVISALCDQVHAQMVAGIDSEFSGKFLAVLFKNPTMSKRVFELGSV